MTIGLRIGELSKRTKCQIETRGFYLTSRRVVWDLAEVEAWVEARRQTANAAQLKKVPIPDVRRHKRRPVRAAPAS